MIRAIDNLQADIVIYTDGSRKAGIENGGAAAVVTQGNASNPIILETLKDKGRALTSSYEEEKAALKRTSHEMDSSKAPTQHCHLLRQPLPAESNRVYVSYVTGYSPL